MPKPNGPQADTKPIHEQVRKAMRKAHQDRMAPIAVSFSDAGYSQAQAETTPGMDPWLNVVGAGVRKYLGLPYTIDPAQALPVSLTLVPGGSQEAKDFRAAQRSVDAQHPGRQTPHGYHAERARMMVSDEATLTMMGKAANAAQVCDFIRAYLDKPEHGLGLHWGNLERALDRAVVQHGRFE